MVSTMLLDEIELLYALFIVLIHDLMLALKLLYGQNRVFYLTNCIKLAAFINIQSFR